MRYIPIDSVDEILVHQKVKIDFVSALGPKKHFNGKARIADTVFVKIERRRIKVLEIKGTGVDYWEFNREGIQLIDYEPGLIATSKEIEALDFRKDSILFRMGIEVYRKIRKKLIYEHHRVENIWIPKNTIEGIMVEHSTRSDMANLLGKLFQSDASKFVFSLGDIPIAITDAVLRVQDSLDVEARLLQRKSTLETFMADTYGKWNATDVIINGKWPSRRFIYAVNAGTKWILTYEHGGVGNHFHVVYIDMVIPRRLSAGVTLLNMDAIKHLVFEKKQDEIASLKINLILRADEFYVFDGRIVRDDDMF